MKTLLSVDAYNQGRSLLAEKWKSEFTNPLTMKDYYEAVEILPDEAFFEVVKYIRWTARYCPTPQEFRDKANDWHRRYREEHGHRYGEEKKDPNADQKIDCIDCMDIGWTHVGFNATGTLTWCFCVCPVGEKQIKAEKFAYPRSRIPQYGPEMRNLGFSLKTFPVDQFKPSNPKSPTYSALTAKYKEWKKDKADARKYWESGVEKDFKQAEMNEKPDEIGF